MGQGAAQAIEDAATLKGCLSKFRTDISAALRLYERLRLPRASACRECRKPTKFASICMTERLRLNATPRWRPAQRTGRGPRLRGFMSTTLKWSQTAEGLKPQVGWSCRAPGLHQIETGRACQKRRVRCLGRVEGGNQLRPPTCLLSSQEETNHGQSRATRQAIKAMLDERQPVPLRSAT